VATNTNDRESDDACKAANDVRRGFSELPLDRKLSTLIQIEFDLLKDAVETVASSVSKVVDEVADAFTERPASAKPDAADPTPTS